MMWTLFSLIGFCLAAEAPVPTPVVDALHQQLTRNMSELKLGDAPDIYHIRYHLYTMKQMDATAAMGAIIEESTEPYQYLGVEVRVGSPSYDNTGFGGWENGFTGSWMPKNLTPRAATLSAWRQTDRAYKQAVEHYSRKKAQFVAPPNYPGDYILLDSYSVDYGAGTTSDTEQLRDLAQAVSSVLGEDPAIMRGQVHVGQEAGSHWIMDTVGSTVRRPMQESTLRALIHVRAPDGMLLTDQRLWSTQHSSQLPPKNQMVSETTAMRTELLALQEAPSLTDEYVGPVLFEDNATIDLFRFLIVPQLEGTPSEVPFESFLGDIGNTSTGSFRIGRRLLPPGWNVFDDPTSNADHPSAFAVDAEGTPTERVHAVQDGIIQIPLMSRVPRKEYDRSNGHARGINRARLAGRVSQLDIQPEKSRSPKKIHKEAIQLAESYGRDWYIAVRRLQEPAVRAIGSAPSFMSGDDSGAFLPPPVSIERVYSDGRRETLRGAQFSSVQRWILRDIVAAGAIQQGTFMIPSSPGGGLHSPTQGLTTWMRAPSVLIGEMEMVPMPGDPKSKTSLPHPSTRTTKK